jgi:tetratricopeptide (TPR) repeat protein
MASDKLNSGRMLFVLVCLEFVGCGGFVDGWNRVKANDLISKAGEKIGASDFKGNVELLEDAARIDPTNPQVWWKLCEGYQFTEQLELAIAACKKNIELHPADGIAYNSLGLAYMADNDYPKAVEAFETAVAKSPQPVLYRNYAWALRSSGQYEKAVTATERLVELSSVDSPEVRPALQELANAYLGVQQYDKTIAVTQRLVELDAKDPAEQVSALEHLGALYALTGQTKKAQEALENVHAVNPQITLKSCEITGDREKGFGVKCSFSP